MNEQNNDVVKQETVSNNKVDIPSMDEYSKELDNSFKKLSDGDIVKGTVIGISDNELLVNIGYISDGIIPINEITLNENESLKELYKEGDEIEALVVKKDDGEGNVILSIKKAEKILIWEELNEALKSNSIINVKVNEVVKGGVTCLVKGIKAFIPASLLSVKYVKDLNEYIGKELKVKVVELNKEKRKVILSRKEVEEKELEDKKNELLNSIKKGEKYIGKVTKLMNFGAFVDLGGIEGLVHNNDLSWSRIKHPSEIVKEGDTVEVYVINVDKEKERIALGLKDVNDNPWKKVNEKFSVGDIVSGQIVRLTDFGAFVKISQGIEGLVHVSEISDKRVESPKSVLAIDDTVNVKILSIDEENKKISLSIKEALADKNKEEIKKYKSTEQATTNLKDVFKVFLKDIEK